MESKGKTGNEEHEADGNVTAVDHYIITINTILIIYQ